MWEALLSAFVTLIGNIALSERQKNVSEQQVDNMNQYNLPANQVQRLKDAGINPAAGLMGNGLSVSGNTSAQPNQYQLPNISDPLSIASNSMLAMANAKDVESTRDVRIKLINEQANQARVNAEKLGIDSSAQLILNRYLALQQEYALSESKARTDLAYWQVNEIKQGLKRMQFELEKLLPAELKKTLSEADVNLLSLDKILAEIADLEASAGLKGAQHHNVEAQTEHVEQSIDIQGYRYKEVADKLIEKYGAEIRNLAASAGLTEEETYWYLFKVESQFRMKVNDMPNGAFNRGTMQSKINSETKKRYGD